MAKLAVVAQEGKAPKLDVAAQAGGAGDINYSYYVDALILQDVSDYPGLKRIKKAYLDINELLEIVPVDGMFGVPLGVRGPCPRQNRRQMPRGCYIIATYSKRTVGRSPKIGMN